MTGRYVSKPTRGRRFAIGDIHGCYDTLRKLIEDRIELQIHDQLFLLGDYINRGPKSAKVLDYIIQLRADNYPVYPIRGNHEQMLIEAGINELAQTYRGFLPGLLYYYETDDFYLVHAGINFRAANPLKDTHSMLWMREPPLPNKELPGSKRVVHGHTIYALPEIKKAVVDKASVLPIDNGCYKGLHKEAGEYGNLCTLNLDTFELIIQKNIDKKQ